ncbi:MAG: creatininase family protein, partial [Gemmatimonadota bacterium]|nr:creatininase family protein [Gemmatimonadota bacterium]
APWDRVRDLERPRAIALRPPGAPEAHGPPRPTDTDVAIADALAEAGGRNLAEAGLDVVLLPALAYTPAGFAAEFPGTISVSPETGTALVVDIATSLHDHGFGVLAIANAHFDPGHLTALHAAVDAIRASGLMTVAFPDVTRRPWVSRLTEEFRSGACHAGRYEGSIVLARTPHRVDGAKMRDLPPHPVSLADAIRDGKTTFGEAGGDRAYFGSPAEATADEGRQTIATLGEILAESVREAIDEGGVA